MKFLHMERRPISLPILSQGFSSQFNLPLFFLDAALNFFFLSSTWFKNLHKSIHPDYETDIETQTY